MKRHRRRKRTRYHPGALAGADAHAGQDRQRPGARSQAERRVVAGRPARGGARSAAGRGRAWVRAGRHRWRSDVLSTLARQGSSGPQAEVTSQAELPQVPAQGSSGRAVDMPTGRSSPQAGGEVPATSPPVPGGSPMSLVTNYEPPPTWVWAVLPRLGIGPRRCYRCHHRPRGRMSRCERCQITLTPLDGWRPWRRLRRRAERLGLGSSHLGPFAMLTTLILIVTCLGTLAWFAYNPSVLDLVWSRLAALPVP